MNFLAHLFLSCEREPLLIGNFLADFIKNRDVPQFPASIVEGIYLHRKIDSYTDNHPEVRRGVRRLYARHGKYAPVLVDVFYDYLLAKNWELYSERPLLEFTGHVYGILLRNLNDLPAFLQEQTRRMVADDWLMNYTHLEGLSQTFARMRRRVSKPELFEGAIVSLRTHEEKLDEEFQLFFPDVIRFVQAECRC